MQREERLLPTPLPPTVASITFGMVKEILLAAVEKVLLAALKEDPKEKFRKKRRNTQRRN
jgi:hypothetical protein